MFLIDSGRLASAPQATVDEILGILAKAGATVVAHRPWQEGKLAYPIEGHGKGLYYLTFFRMDGDGVAQIVRSCKLSDVVLRHLIINHPPVLFDAMVNALSGHENMSLDGEPERGTAVKEGGEEQDGESSFDSDEVTDESDETVESEDL